MSPPSFKILVADDEESLRGIVTEVLTDSGYTVQSASDGQQALDMVKATNDFHVVISDIRMPGLNGIELLEEIKKFNPQIQVIIMTSHGSLETAIKAIRLGAYDYLTKPFDDLDVITTVINRTVEKLKLELQVKGLVNELTRRKEDVEVLYNSAAQIATTLDPEDILGQSANHLANLARCDTVLYLKYDKDSQSIRGHKGVGWKGSKLGDLHFEVKGEKSVKNYFDVIDSDTELKKRMSLTSTPHQTLLLPLRIENEVIGLYAAANKTEWTIDSKALMLQFMGNISTQMEKAKLHAQVAELAIRDGMTGLFNHRHFQQMLQMEIERARRFKGKFTLILFDIDHFKTYNDTNGHQMGDYLLTEMGRLVDQSVRRIDLAARYGGEEFIIIATENDRKGAIILAERIREKVAKYAFKNREKQPLGCISISVGVAEFPKDGDTKEAVIAAADQALYRAKKQGRNRVEPAGS